MQFIQDGRKIQNLWNVARSRVDPIRPKEYSKKMHILGGFFQKYYGIYSLNNNHITSDTSTEDYAHFEKHYKYLRRMKSGNNILLQDELKRTFTLMKNPYQFLINCFSYNANGPLTFRQKSLEFAILEGFKCYGKQDEADISVKLQKDAFFIAKYTSGNVTESLFKIFHLQKRKDMFLPYLKKDLKQGNYKFVCAASIYMNLQNELSPVELSLPLYFLDFNTDLKNLLLSSKNHSTAFIGELDNFIGNKYYFSYILKSVPNNTNMQKKSIKTIDKMASTVMGYHNIDSTLYTNYTYNKNMKILYFLYRLYFTEKKITKFSFCLFLRDIVIQSPTLKSNVLKRLRNHEETFKTFIKVLENIGDISSEERVDNYQDKQSYYQLSIHKDLIYYVSTLYDFQKSITNILSCSVVGIDLEFQPTMVNNNGKFELALIQLAVEDAVYVIDIYQLSKLFLPKHWEQLGKIFSSKILKLVYGFQFDASCLSDINETLASHINSKINMIEFDDVKNVILLNYPKLFSYNINNQEKGLSELVYLCFGLPLNKRYQFSYWIHRPLTFTEIQYAAIDAHCLINIKKYLDDKSFVLGIDDWTK